MTEGRQDRTATAPGDGAASTARDRAGALILDRAQADVVIAALEDAAVLRREAIGYCPRCGHSPAATCPDHEGSRQAASDYDALRSELEAATADPARARPAEPAPEQDEASRAQDEAFRAECEAFTVPRPARPLPPEVINAMIDHVEAVNRRALGPDGELDALAGETDPPGGPGRSCLSASYPGWPTQAMPDPGPDERQLADWNTHNDHTDGLGLDDPEAGE